MLPRCLVLAAAEALLQEDCGAFLLRLWARIFPLLVVSGAPGWGAAPGVCLTRVGSSPGVSYRSEMTLAPALPV